MTKLSQKIDEGMGRLKFWQLVVLLFFSGSLTGLGGGGALLEAFSDHVTYEDIQPTLDSIKRDMRYIRNNGVEATELLMRTRCEIRSIREDFDWLECWGPDAPGRWHE
jgi:hypothetical protein